MYGHATLVTYVYGWYKNDNNLGLQVGWMILVMLDMNGTGG